MQMESCVCEGKTHGSPLAKCDAGVCGCLKTCLSGEEKLSSGSSLRRLDEKVTSFAHAVVSVLLSAVGIA